VRGSAKASLDVATPAYRPLRLEDYLTRTVLRSGSPLHGAIAQTKPTLFSLPVTSAPTDLDILGAQPNSQPSQFG